MNYEDETEVIRLASIKGAMDEDKETRHERLSLKNQKEIDAIIGEEPRALEGISTDWYYRDLIAWATKHCLIEEGWNTLAAYGYSGSEPLHRNISTEFGKEENCLISGQLVMERDAMRIVVTVDIRGHSEGHDVQVEAPKANEETVREIVGAIGKYVNDHNFYAGKMITLTYDGIKFLPPVNRSWDSVILDPVLKDTIRRNTVGFLQKLERWPQYGIPAKRGIILAGASGTGKTITCKALMTEAEGMTRLVGSFAAITEGAYFGTLYELAEDLAPCIVFIEDLDSIGQQRWGMYHGTPQLVSLLDEMDGIGEKSRIVTVATTNHVESLDEALRTRPARFDRVVEIPAPSADLRAAHIDRLSGKIHLDREVKDHLVRKTEGLSPAQVQETMFGLVINREDDVTATGNAAFSTADVDRVIGELKCTADRRVGFGSVHSTHP